MDFSGLTLEIDGLQVFPNSFNQEELKVMTVKLDDTLQKYEDIKEKKKVNLGLKGIIHHPLLFDDYFVYLLSLTNIREYIKNWFRGRFILNTYGGIINSDESGEYVHQIHSDTRFYAGEYRLFLNLLIAIDNFTVENGATKILIKRGLPKKPDEQYFNEHATDLLLNAGDIVLFDSNLWHRAGQNITKHPRRCLTMTFARPWIKPQFDYIATSSINPNNLEPFIQQILGFNSRTPSSIENWFLPEEERFYKKDQDILEDYAD